MQKVEIQRSISWLYMHNNNNKRLITIAIAFFAVGGLFITTGLSTAYAQTTTTQEIEQTAQQIVDTQQSAAQYVTDDLRNQGNLEYNIRWSPVTTVESGSMKAIFADCWSGEFAVSSMFMYENEDVQTVQSFPIGIPDNLMSWLTVANNAGDEDVQVSTGVVCVGDEGVDRINLDASTRTTIQNTINGIGSTDINYITKIYQSIVQKAIQIVNITGSNNTVNQVINQSAGQIIESRGASVNQTIDQTAEQVIGANATAVLQEEEEILEDEELIEPQQGPALPPILETPTTTPPADGETPPPPEEEPTETPPAEEEEPPAEEPPAEEEEEPPLEDAETTEGELTDDADNTAEGE